MRILLCSHVFAPSIGGIETVSGILAEQFSGLGHHVKVVTQTPGGQVSPAFEVVRRPSLKKLYKLGRDADIIFQSNISLQTLLPLFPVQKPIVITHHGSIARTSGRRGLRDYMKRALLPACHNIAISRAVADDLPVKSTIIGDPFDAGEFSNYANTSRDKDIVFLGRLVSDKGCDVALRALALLKAEGISPTLSIIGDGPELPKLKELTAGAGLTAQVTFLGAMREGRGREVARHKIMVIPSVWAEPFGVVALEGLAAGCALAASSAGGLAEAVGPCGLLFPNGDSQALAQVLRRLLLEPELRQELVNNREPHLAQFAPEVAAAKYLCFFEAILTARQSNVLAN